MKYIKQLLIILVFSLLGQLMEKMIPIPVPAAIYGFLLLFLALCLGLLKPEHIRHTATFLIKIMGIFFVAPAVNILAYYEVIAPALVPICIIVVSSTVVVFAVAGTVTRLLRRKEGQNG